MHFIAYLWDEPNCLRTFYLTGTQASGANIDMTRGTLHNCLDTLYIGLPCSVGPSMGMGYLVAESNTLSADLTLCHFWIHLLTIHEKTPMFLL